MIKTTGYNMEGDGGPQSDAEPTQIERVARAICRVEHDDPDRRMPTSENPPDGRPVWTAYERQAQAAIAALTQSDAEPPGHTDLMVKPETLDAYMEANPLPADAEPVRAFAKTVLHGDDEHKAWLLEAAEAFIGGKPLPAPRGKGTQSAAEPFEHCPICGKDEDHEHGNADVDAWLKTQSDTEPVKDVRELTKAVSYFVCKGACIPGLTFGLDCAMCRTKIQQGIELFLPLIAPPRPDASAGLVEAAVLERYAQSIAMWCYRENVTDYERLSYIANHPVTRKYANRARAADRSGK